MIQLPDTMTGAGDGPSAPVPCPASPRSAVPHLAAPGPAVKDQDATNRGLPEEFAKYVSSIASYARHVEEWNPKPKVLDTVVRHCVPCITRWQGPAPCWSCRRPGRTLLDLTSEEAKTFRIAYAGTNEYHYTPEENAS